MSRRDIVEPVGPAIPLHEKVTLGEIVLVCSVEADRIRLYNDGNSRLFNRPLCEHALRKEKVMRAVASLAEALIPIMPEVSPLLEAQKKKAAAETAGGAE